MRYKLGQLIEEYDEINDKGEFQDLESLQGINSLKYFQECKSNKNDIDLYRYRICRKGMFAYNRATSRNGEKISIAYREGNDCLISPSYYCFKIVRKDLLLADYLMIWFKRPIFDKYARFHSWGSATEFFTFEDFCNTEISLPSIEEQRKIVRNYKVITDRIELLKKIKKNLYFQSEIVFKNISSNELITISSLRGIHEIPSGITKFANSKKYYATGDIDYDYKMSTCEIISYNERPSRANMEPKINSLWFAKMQNTNKFLFFNEQSKDLNNVILSTGFMGIECKENIFYYLLSFVFTKNFNDQKDRFATGTTQVAINSDALNKIMIPIPLENKEKEYELLKNIFNNIQSINEELGILLRLKELHLSTLSKTEVA